MTDLLRKLVPFRLEGKLDERFTPVFRCKAFRRTKEMECVLRDHKVPGVYFWLLKHKSAYYSIYVGQTVSLSGRLGTYLGSFQAHAPNDFKLQIFFDFVTEQVPGADFELYFLETDRSNLHSEEGRAIKKYSPLLNNLPQPTKEEKEKLQNVFSSYYRSVFQRRLNP